MIKRLLSGLRIQKREEHPGSLFIPNTFPRDGLEMELFFISVILDCNWYHIYIDKVKGQSGLSEKKEVLKKINFSLGIAAAYGTNKINLTPDLGKKIHDLIYEFAKAKNLIDSISGNSVSKEKQNSLYKNRIKNLGGKWMKKLDKLPVTITVYQPSFSAGFAWGRKTLESQTNCNAPITYDVFLKADPLFKMEGSLDLITCATFMPVIGQVIKVVDIVLNVAGIEPVLKLTAMGEIKLSLIGTIKVDGDTNEKKLETKMSAGLKMTIEASITIGDGLVGFMFAGGDIIGTVTKKTYTAYAETGFELNLSTGVTAHKGPYVGVKLEFLGLIAAGKLETKMDEYGGTSEESFKYIIIEKTTFIDKTFYF